MPSGGACCINRGAALLVAAAIWSYLLLVSAPLVIEAANGSIYFSANRSFVLAPGDCVTLRWSVEGIQAVYLNEQPQVGSGEQQFCSANVQPTLRVIFQDGSEQTYTLNITPLLTHPLTGILIALLGYTAAPYLPTLLLFPLTTSLRLALISALLILFFTQLSPLGEIIATANWRDASAALATMLTITALGGLLVLAVVNRHSQPVNTRRLLLMWAAGAGVLFVLVVGLILYVNPRGMYFAHNYNPHQLLLRERKTAGYLNLPTTPDLVIMGSSRAFTLAPAQTGYTAYNMAIEGGRIEDMLIQVRQMRNLPKILWIEVQEGLPREPDDIAARAPFSWLLYMSAETRLLTIEQRLTGLVDLSQFAEALYIQRYNDIYKRQPQEWPIFEGDGLAVRPLISAAQLEQAILLDIGNIPPQHCEEVNPTSQADMSELIEIATAQNSQLVFYLSPWHPRYREAVLDNDPQYQTCYAAFSDYMDTLTQHHTNVTFVNASHMEGLDTSEAGFYDSQHLTEANSNRLIDLLRTAA